MSCLHETVAATFGKLLSTIAGYCAGVPLSILAIMTNSPRQFPFNRVATAALLAGVAAAVLNLIVYAVASAAGVAFIVQMDSSSPAGPMPAPSFAIGSFVPALVAGGLLLALDVFTKHPVRIFVGIAAAVALLSMGGPATVAAASFGTHVALAVMHVVAAATITTMLLRRGRAA